MNTQQSEGPEEEKQERKKILIKQPFFYPTASTHYLCKMLGAHRCAQTVKGKRRETSLPLDLPGLAALNVSLPAPPVFLTLCHALQHNENKNFTLNVSSALEPRDFFSKKTLSFIVLIKN